jgi:hypothetical protein
MMMKPGEDAMEEMSWETRARNLSPEVVVPLDVAFFPQEAITRQAANRIRKTKDALFKQGTPNTMIEKDLERNRAL